MKQKNFQKYQNFLQNVKKASFYQKKKIFKKFDK